MSWRVIGSGSWVLGDRSSVSRQHAHGRAIARRYTTLRGLLPPSTRYSPILKALTPERMLVMGLIIFLVALSGLVWSLWQWIAVDFGPLTDDRILRVLTLGFTGIAAAVQLWLTAFLASLMEINQKP